tara:strand:- start:2645 stop:4084 length:1440 start_codon:yes stop_codon:yes gene_type:complete
MAVAAGSSFTVVVSEDGSIFSFGSNVHSQLGTGDTDLRLAPTRVRGLPAPVRQVAAGDFHTGIVTDVGDLLMCGLGWHGRLGLGYEQDRTTPTLVPRAVFEGEAVLMVSCGYFHTAVATEGGGVYTFGKGGHGRLGHGNEENQLAPRRVPAAGFRPNGSAEGPGERVVMVAAGNAHTVGLSEAGHVFTWGYGEDGRLGHGDQETRLAPRQVEAGRFGRDKVVFVAAGVAHTAAVTEGGRLYTWGYGLHGQLGHDDIGNRLVPTLVGAGVFRGSTVVMAACGFCHTLVVTQDGGLWACGEGRFGRLGLNDTVKRRVFERVRAETFGGARVVAAAAGNKHSAAVTDDGALWTWGFGGNGRLGLGDNEHRLAPTRVTVATRIGRCRPLPEDHALALSMGTHSRLGGEFPIASLDREHGLISMIARAAGFWVSGKAAESEGLIRLIGGVSANRRLRYVQMLKPSFSRVGRDQARWCKKCLVPP